MWPAAAPPPGIASIRREADDWSDSVDGGRAADFICILRQRRIASLRHIVDGTEDHAAGGRDDSIGVTEVLFRAILNGAHAFHGPLVMHVDVHAHPGIGRRALFFGIIAPVIRQVGGGT